MLTTPSTKLSRKLCLSGLLAVLWLMTPSSVCWGTVVDWTPATVENLYGDFKMMTPTVPMTASSNLSYQTWSVACDQTKDAAAADTTKTSVAYDDIGVIGQEISGGIEGENNVNESVWVLLYPMVPTNLVNITVYCVFHPKGIAASDPGVQAHGIELTATVASAPTPYIHAPSTLDLGSCSYGDVIEKTLPLSASVVGYYEGSNTMLDIDWTITADANNPDASLPIVIQNGKSPAQPLQITVDHTDKDVNGLGLQLVCGHAGKYTWTMTITSTAE